MPFECGAQLLLKARRHLVLSSSENSELLRFNYRPKLFAAISALEFDKTVVAHRFERPGQIADLAAGKLRKLA